MAAKWMENRAASSTFFSLPNSASRLLLQDTRPYLFCLLCQLNFVNFWAKGVEIFLLPYSNKYLVQFIIESIDCCFAIVWYFRVAGFVWWPEDIFQSKGMCGCCSIHHCSQPHAIHTINSICILWRFIDVWLISCGKSVLHR